jgi:hypothetical protein
MVKGGKKLPQLGQGTPQLSKALQTKKIIQPEAWQLNPTGGQGARPQPQTKVPCSLVQGRSLLLPSAQ